jgi:hypothetical protein
MNHAASIVHTLANRAGFLSACIAALFIVSGAMAQVPVQVIVDMDPDQPGIQSLVQLRQCETVAHDIAVYIIDPINQRSLYSIGYLGGIDRGIGFGHTPDNGNDGSVVALSAAYGAPANPGNTAWITPGFISMFAGAEINYIEAGADSPAVLSAQPANPIFTVDVTLRSASTGDEYRFYLVDVVAAWAGVGYGAFSTTAPINALDCGGDSVPDQTITSAGIDPDDPAPSPPAAFSVDYIDGPVRGGGAVIQIIPKLGDINADAIVNASDLLIVIGAWGPCAPDPPCDADVNGDGAVNVVDLLQVISNWGGCD